MDWIWKAILIIIVGTIILRIAGRKSISQMTLSQTVIMIAIGSLLIQPVAGKNVWVTFGVGGVLVLTLIAMEVMQVKFDFMEKFLTGKSKPVIVNGQLNDQNLKKMRL
ncbi:MAG: YetF domain-containing protein, partial [Halobacillus sp.]